MVRLGKWLFFGAFFLLLLIFGPPWIDPGGSRYQVAADALFCDSDGTAVLSINLTGEALAKRNLSSVIGGFCAAQSGQRMGSIPVERFANTLTGLGLMALAGLFLMVTGGLRRNAQRTAQPYIASGTGGFTMPTAADNAARTAQRDREDVAAQRYAAQHRPAAQAPKAAAPATAMPDWLAGMPASELSPAAPPPSERFTFEEQQMSDAATVQLNQLQLALESSLITRSEYDARRAALLKAYAEGGSSTGQG